MEECAYCNREVADETIVPAIDDDKGWAELAREHQAGCEWIETRAHRIGVRGAEGYSTR